MYEYDLWKTILAGLQGKFLDRLILRIFVSLTPMLPSETFVTWLEKQKNITR